MLRARSPRYASAVKTSSVKTKSSEILSPGAQAPALRTRRRRCQACRRPPARRPRLAHARGRRARRARFPLPPLPRRASVPRRHLPLAPPRIDAKRNLEMGGLRAASTAFATLGPRCGSSARRCRMSASSRTLERRIPVGSTAAAISHSTRPTCQSMRTRRGAGQSTRQAWWTRRSARWTRRSARRARWLPPQQARLVCVCGLGHVHVRLHALCDWQRGALARRSRIREPLARVHAPPLCRRSDRTCTHLCPVFRRRL